MRSKQSISTMFFVLAMGLASSLPGCAQPAATPDLTPTPTAEVSLPPEVTRVAPPPASEGDLPELVAGNGTFPFDLYEALREEEGNLFYSPYSLSAALAMTYAGARGETERQMAETLHYTLSQARLHPAFNALDHRLAAGGEAGEGAFRLDVANSLWGQDGFPFRQDFMAELAQNYGTRMQLVDYVDASRREAARQAINRWVEGLTQGKIQDLIGQDILTELTRLVLANAIYFKADWVDPFRNGTREASFTRLDGSQVSVPMMSRRKDAPYAEGDDYQVIELPYKGDRISMVVLLPAEGQFENFENSLSRARVDEILEALQMHDIKLYLPKFSFSSKLMLNKKLQAMGMPDAFDPAKADFSGMYDPSQTDEIGLHISHVVHQAFVAVDEEGTEAAAATGVVEEMVSEPILVRVDRPFVFLIRDRLTGTILFLGRCVDPTVGG